jgi:hypothetical protein
MSNGEADNSMQPSSGTAGSGRHFVVKAAPRLTASGNSISLSEEEDQPVLLEAKLIEIIISTNQLISSNHALDEALEECDDQDEDLLIALKENEDIISRKICDATRIAATLNKHGVHISLTDKMLQYNGSSVLKKMREQKEQSNKSDCDGIYL